MNGIILYGSRYGAARQYALSTGGEDRPPAVSYAEVRDFGPLTPLSMWAVSTPAKPPAWPKPPDACPQTIPSACWWPPWAWRTRPTRTICSPFGSPWPRSSPRHLCPDRSCPSAGGHRLPGAEHQAPADDEGLCAILRRQPVTERTADTQALLDSYGNAVSFIDFDTLAPIEAWLKKRMKAG